MHNPTITVNPEFKSFESLRFCDSFMFEAVIEDTELYKDILETILQRPVGELTKIEGERGIRMTENGKVIRLSIVSDENPARAYRFSKKDVYGVSPVTNSYCRLEDRTEVTFCTFDPFGYGAVCYAAGDKMIWSQDRSDPHAIRKYFVNTWANPIGIPREFRRLFEYMNSGIVSDKLTDRIDRKVRLIKSSAEKKAEYLRRVAWLEGIKEQAREEGSVQRLIEQVTRKIKKGKSIAEIAEDLDEDINLILAVCPYANKQASGFDIQGIYDMLFPQKSKAIG